MRTKLFKSTLPSSSPLQTFSETIMEETIAAAEEIITRWDYISQNSNFYFIVSLFCEDHQTEAKEFIGRVKDLQSAMQFLISANSNSSMLVRGQNLMQIAMKLLQKEFCALLKTYRDCLYTESISSRSSDFENEAISENIVDSKQEIEIQAMNYLQMIADCMINTGYGKECVKIYKIMRKSAVNETLYRLGHSSQSKPLHKMEWETAEITIRKWITAVKFAVTQLFAGERILCSHFFSSYPAVHESCFSDVVRDGALALFAFPQQIAKCKKSPEKLFAMLDIYDVISELGHEIDSVFGSDSTSAVRIQAAASQAKIGDSIRRIIAEFESAIKNNRSKSPVPGGNVHPLTRYVMNYLVFLADYLNALSEIFDNVKLIRRSPSPATYSDSRRSGEPESNLSKRFAWLILVLLCKLNRNADLYGDVSLSYLFLANNLQYVLCKVRDSKMRALLGDQWIANHEIRVREYAANYESAGWRAVVSAAPANKSAAEEVEQWFRRFNAAFQGAYHKQVGLVVADEKLRDEIKSSLVKMVIPRYREMYERYREMMRGEAGNRECIVKFAPEDLENYLSALYDGNISGSTTTTLFSRGGKSSVSSTASSRGSPSLSRLSR